METNSSDNARKIAEEALSRLSAELEGGRSEALRKYLAVMGRFHRYSWGNTLLIASQRPDATRVAGFHAWHKLGRSVKKGEKGIMILAPMVVKHKEPAPDDRTQPERENPEDAFRLAGFRIAYVFDVSQTDGQPLPAFAKTTGDVRDYGDKLRAIAAARGISVEYDRGIAPAMGISSGGRIRLMPDMQPSEEFSVLVHEMAHEMLHHGPEATRSSKLVRETQAEAVAFVVCRGVGLETNNAAADYIALSNGDKKTLGESLAVIQQTATRILDDLTPEKKTATQALPAESVDKTHASFSPDLGASDQGVPETLSPPQQSFDMGR